MYNKERVKTIVSEWFEFKTGIILSDETLSKLVDDITETKQCDIPDVVGRSEQLVCETCGEVEVQEQGDWCDKCLGIDKAAN